MPKGEPHTAPLWQDENTRREAQAGPLDAGKLLVPNVIFWYRCTKRRTLTACFHVPRGEPRTASPLTRRKHPQDARRRNCTSEELNMCPIWIGCFNSSFGIAIPRGGSRLDVFTCQRAGPRATSHVGKTKTVAVGVLAD